MEFDPIVLHYEGIDANGERIDLAQVGQSLQGAAQLLGTAASIVSTGEYAKRASTMPVKILAGMPRQGSWELPAIIISVLPAVNPDLFASITKKLATEATTKIVNFVVSCFAGKNRPTEVVALETVQKAMAELGQTSRHAIDAVVRMSEQQRSAVRSLVSPVGISCETLQVGEQTSGAILIDRELRSYIDAPVDVEVQASSRHEILISEMDRVNQTCKFSFRSDGDSERRLPGEITDPLIQTPNDPYSAAFSSQRWIHVVGKLQIKAGEADKLFISDIVPN